MATRIDGDLDVLGALSCESLNADTFSLTLGNANIADGADIERTKLEQNTLVPFPIDLAAVCKVWDARQTNLPGTAAADDLAIITGTFGTNAVRIRSSDGKATSITQRLGFELIVPAEYDPGQTLTLRIRAGMVTTISDTTATVDVEARKLDEDGAVGSDICTTAATTINSLTKANCDFTITPTGLVAGDRLDIRVTITITDGATGTAVIGEISRIVPLVDIRG